jgi:hypothetical protein
MNALLLPGRIEHWPLARLKPYPRNAKTHDADQVVKIAASMAEFGWTVPVLVADDGELIAGYGRVLAAYLGMIETAVTSASVPGRAARIQVHHKHLTNDTIANHGRILAMMQS